MVYVPAGKFTMGSLEGEADEQPRRTFALDAFWIDETEVTNAQYRRCVEDGVCRDPSTGNCSYGSTYRDPEKAEYPVACVSWNDAQAYAKWVGGRLPTEAEWEKAARGTDGWKYPWGNTFDGSRLNYCDKNCEWDHRDSRANDGYAQAGPVASYAQGASPYGVLDMAGNVGEWCSTIYRNYPYDPHDGRENLEVVESTRVWRGGYWGSMEGQVQGAERDKRIPGYRSAAIGFRIARDADEIYLPGPTATATPTATAEPTATATPTPAPRDTPTSTPTVPSPSPSPTPTALPTPTPTPEAG